MPHGRTEAVTIDRPPEIEAMAKEIIALGYVFEIEMLSDCQTISMEIIKPEDDGAGITNELCPNGPAVPDNVDKMIREAHAKLIVQPKEA